MPTGIYQLHWYPTGSREFGYELDWDWVWVRGSKPQTVDVFGQYCPQQCVHMHVASCLLLLLLCSRPFVSPSFVQSFNRKLYCLTHIYLMPPALLGHCVLPLPSRVSHKLEHFHDTCKFPAASQARTLLLPPHTHTSHLTPYHARIAPIPIGKSGIPIRIVCVCVM